MYISFGIRADQETYNVYRLHLTPNNSMRLAFYRDRFNLIALLLLLCLRLGRPTNTRKKFTDSALRLNRLGLASIRVQAKSAEIETHSRRIRNVSRLCPRISLTIGYPEMNDPPRNNQLSVISNQSS